MSLIESFVRNPVKVSVGVLLVVLFGAISLVKMPKQLTPDVENPVITISTRWPGASPAEVEREIILAQEEELKAVAGVNRMSSQSSDSRCEITLEFEVGTDLEEALLKVNTRLQQVREYPIDASEPVISSSNISDRPIARFVITARPPEPEEIAAFAAKHPELKKQLDRIQTAMNPGLKVFRLRQLKKEVGHEYPDLDPLVPEEIDFERMQRFMDNVVEARFERVAGVADAYVYGGREEELQIVVDPQRLAARGLTVGDVRSVLQGRNKDTSGGTIEEGKRRWVIRTLGQFRSEQDVEDQILTVQNGAPVYLRDVAEVRVGFKKRESIARRYGISSTGCAINRESGANVLAVMSGLDIATKELNEGPLKQRGIQLYQYYDETDYIYSAIGLVQQNIFVGGALTMIVLMLFLNSGLRTILFTPFIAASAAAAAYISPWFFIITLILIVIAGFWLSRGALVVGLAIPTSIVGTFLLLGLFGRSLNVISLAGMAFAVGMLVDNAVVVLENIHRHRALGESPLGGAVNGTKEVSGAVLASTLTTVAVFLPVLFVEEVAGQLFRDIALAISCAVGLSLLVSVAVIPTASSRLFRDRRTPSDDSKSASKETSAATRFLQNIGNSMVGSIVGLNRWIQAGYGRSLAVIALLVGLSLGLAYWFWPKVEYLPEGDRNFIFAFMSPPPGYNMDELMMMGEKVESDMQSLWDADPDDPNPQGLAKDFPIIHYYFFFARGKSVMLGFQAHDPQRVGELIPLVNEVGTQFPGTRCRASQSSLFARGMGAGRSIDIEITGPDLETLIGIGGDVLANVERILPTAQASPEPSLDLSSPEVHLEPKLTQAAELGVDATQLGYTVDALVDGAYAGDYFVGGERIDMSIVGSEEFASRTQDLENLPIATPTGQLVPLGALAKVTPGSGPEQIHRRERQRAITISVSPDETTPLEEAMDLITAEIIQPMEESGRLEGGYSMQLSGTADKLKQTWDALRWNLVLALAITYLLMAALFESWLYPLVIIFSVPLGAVGGIVGLKVLNLFIYQPLDVLTMLGFVILIGTVVNNAILIVHQSLNFIREDGMSPREAIPASVRTRIRPIFMTTLTTVLGLLPLVVFPGAGSELYRGLGSVVLGGMLISTVFTLVLVPTVFVLAMDLRSAVARMLFKTPAPVQKTEPASV
ncbi:MAG: efflux RND transporter permease subunit [Planctomycetaceae bacterium]